MEDLKKKHLTFLTNKGPFKIDCNTIIFSEEEISILKRYGHWFKALTDGILPPITEKQKLFIEVAKGKRDPFSIEEWTWFRYLGRKRIEQEKGDSLYNTPRLEDDPFYSREGLISLRKIVYKTISEQHRK